MKRLLRLLIVLFILVGCSNNKDKSKDEKSPDLVCTMSQEISGATMETKDVFENDGTKVTGQIGEVIVKSEDTEILQALKERYEGAYDSYNDYNGVTFKMEDIEGGFKMTLTIDYQIVSKETLVAINVIDDSAYVYIGIKESKTLNEEAGATCSYK